MKVTQTCPFARGYSFDFELFFGKRGVCVCVRCGGEGGGEGVKG